jgi:hypothetical protein
MGEVTGWLRARPWLVAGSVVALLVAAAALAVLSRGDAPVPGQATWDGRLVFALLLLPSPLVGAIIASRYPENSYGWAWLIFGLGGGLLTFSTGYVIYGMARPGVPAVGWVGLLSAVGWPASFFMVPFLVLFFPTGRLPSPRWRGFARVVAWTAMLALGLGLFIPGPLGTAPVDNPIGISGPLGGAIEAIVGVATLLVLAAAIPAGLSLIARFRTAPAIERLQLKWFALAVALFVVVYASDWVWEADGVWESLKEGIAIALLPVAIGVAILRYRLYEIDRIIARTVSYTMLTGSLVATYVASVFLLRTLLPVEGELPVAISTLAVAASFNPLRIRFQQAVDRRFNRSRYDAARTVEQFALRLREGADVEDLAERLRSTAASVMQPAHLSLWLQETRP